MAKPRPKKSTEYKYEVSQNEIKYRVMLNLKSHDREALDKFRQDIRDNGGFCLNKTKDSDDNKCMCLEFRNASRQGPCECGLYTKVLRSTEDQQKWRDAEETGPKFDEKKEAKLLKQMKAEEKNDKEDF